MKTLFLKTPEAVKIAGTRFPVGKSEISDEDYIKIMADPFASQMIHAGVLILAKEFPSIDAFSGVPLTSYEITPLPPVDGVPEAGLLETTPVIAPVKVSVRKGIKRG